jgi:hypothetical protein
MIDADDFFFRLGHRAFWGGLVFVWFGFATGVLPAVFFAASVVLFGAESMRLAVGHRVLSRARLVAGGALAVCAALAFAAVVRVPSHPPKREPCAVLASQLGVAGFADAWASAGCDRGTFGAR